MNMLAKKTADLDSTVKTLTLERDTAKVELEKARADVQAAGKQQADLETAAKSLAEKSARVQVSIF
jgi:chromosome segregation ATPase